MHADIGGRLVAALVVLAVEREVEAHHVTDEMGAMIHRRIVETVLADSVDVLAQERFHVRNDRHVKSPWQRCIGYQSSIVIAKNTTH
jgi:hypothetical protein